MGCGCKGRRASRSSRPSSRRARRKPVVKRNKLRRMSESEFRREKPKKAEADYSNRSRKTRLNKNE